MSAPAVSSAGAPPVPPVPRRAYVLSGALGVAILAAAVLDMRPTWAVMAAVAGLVAAATHRWFTRWPVILSSVAVCILVVPIARYALPINLPFAAEPYQVLLAVIGVAWLASLLAQPEALRWRPSGHRRAARRPRRRDGRVDRG